MSAEKSPVSPVEKVQGVVPAAPVTPVLPPAYPNQPAPIYPGQPAPFSPQKPGMVQAIAILTLVNGILNIMWGFTLTISLIIPTVGFSLLCSPLTMLPSVLGIFEIIYGVKLMSNPPKPVKPSQTIAILEICLILLGDVLSVVVGILALVFYNDSSVKAYFNRINGQG